MNTYDAVFFISLAGIIVGLLSLIIKVCLKSKCEHFKLCWGIITIDRRVDLEVQEEMHRMDLGASDDLEMNPAQQQAPPSQSIKRPSIESHKNINNS